MRRDQVILYVMPTPLTEKNKCKRVYKEKIISSIKRAIIKSMPCMKDKEQTCNP